ncbi:MAG: transglutaminase domain-containing protein, partial [Dehalococcoidia bacterium]
MTARDAARPLSLSSQLIAGDRRRSAQAGAQTTRWWRAMESAITLGIVLVVVLSVADSIARANWVAEMPDLRLVAVVAMAVAFVLAAARLHWTLALLLGTVAGAAIVLWQVLTVDSVGGQPFFFDRFEDLWFRLEDWFQQAFNAGITTDNLPFVLFVTAAVWLATFPATFLLLRRRNPWPLLIVLGIILSVNVSYLHGKQWDFNFAFFIGGAALLVMRTTLLHRMDRWRAKGAQFPDFISLSFLSVTILAIVGLMIASRVLPRPDRVEAVSSFWDGITAPFDDLSDEFARLFSGIDSQRGAPIHSFRDAFVLQGNISPGEGIVVRVDSPESGLLRGATYDRYTTRGWQQTGTVETAVDEGAPIGGDSGAGLDAYRDRREVSVRLSVERAPRVLFTFGAPLTIDREVTVEQTAPTTVRLDLTAAPESAPTAELAAAVREIIELQSNGDLGVDLAEATSLIPVEYDVVGVERDADGGLLLALELESAPPEPDVVAVRAVDKVRAGFTYQVTGTVSDADVEALQGAGDAYPLWVQDRFLQLPAELDEDDLSRFQTLAAAVTADATTPYDAAALIEAYLCCSGLLDAEGRPLLDADGNPRLLYPFRTDIELPPVGRDSVSWWLFDYEDDDGLPVGGYYDYHASAMAVLLRSIGVPARVSTGYVLTEDNFDERTRTFIVRGRHAYTWVEVFFPEYGWVDFDPTPPDTGGEFSEIGGRRIAKQRFIGSDIFDESDLSLFEIDPLFGVLLDLENIDLGTNASAESGGGFNLWYVVAPLIALGAVMATSAGGALAWEFSLRNLSPVERAWKSTHRLSRWGGVRAGPTDTPAEYAA